MKLLPQEFTCDGRVLRQMKRTATAAAYQLVGTGGVSYGFEVIKVKRQNECEKFGRIVAAREIYPASSWLNYRGWSYGTNHLRQALEKFDMLVQAGKEKLHAPAPRRTAGSLEETLRGGINGATY
jgi:hypothetical protein